MITKSLQRIKAALLTVPDVTVYHYEVLNQKAPYIVWAEDGGNQFFGGNRMREQAVTATVDLYTKAEYGVAPDEIQQAFDDAGSAWSFSSALYEDDTRLIAYTWEVDVVRSRF